MVVAGAGAGGGTASPPAAADSSIVKASSSSPLLDLSALMTLSRANPISLNRSTLSCISGVTTAEPLLGTAATGACEGTGAGAATAGAYAGAGAGAGTAGGTGDGTKYALALYPVYGEVTVGVELAAALLLGG